MIKFEREKHGAVVAQIAETGEGLIEVIMLPCGNFRLVIHARNEYGEIVDDISMEISNKHFDMLGAVPAAGLQFWQENKQ